MWPYKKKEPQLRTFQQDFELDGMHIRLIAGETKDAGHASAIDPQKFVTKGYISINLHNEHAELNEEIYARAVRLIECLTPVLESFDYRPSYAKSAYDLPLPLQFSVTNEYKMLPERMLAKLESAYAVASARYEQLQESIADATRWRTEHRGEPSEVKRSALANHYFNFYDDKCREENLPYHTRVTRLREWMELAMGKYDRKEHTGHRR